jgi:hypothetical protein
MQMHRRLILALICCALVALDSRAGSLRTRDGQVFDGAVRLSATSATITPPGGGFPLTFPLSDLAAITFKPPLTGVLSGGTLPGDWAVADVGQVALAGSSECTQGLFSLRGEGNQFGGHAEAFHFVYQRMPTDGMLIARVESFPTEPYAADVDPNAKAGLMIRQGAGASNAYAAIAISPNGGATFYARPNADLTSTPTAARSRLRPPCWLKLVKIGNRLAGAQSTDGRKWEQVGEFSLEGLHDACIGLFVTSSSTGQLAAASFNGVRTTIHGIRGQYFADGRFSDPRVTQIDPAINFDWNGQRPAEGVPSVGFSARWTGLIVAPATDSYRFRLEADRGARLIINGTRVLEGDPRIGRDGLIKLIGDAKNSIRVEFADRTGHPKCQLMWATADERQFQPVPNDAFYYAPELPDDAGAAGAAASALTAVPAAQQQTSSRGVLLADGTFLPGTPRSADARALTFLYRDQKPLEIPLAQLAQVYFRPLPPAAAARFPHGPAATAGLLTVSGDFAAGDITALTTEGKLTVESVVSGELTFDTATQAATALYRDPQPAGHWLLRTTAGASVRASAFRVADNGTIALDEPVLGELTLRLSEITDITATNDSR